MLFLMIFTISSLLNAQPAGPRFSADKYLRKADENKVILEGHVTIAKEKILLKADKVELDSNNDNFVAKGNVDYKADKLKINASEIKGNLNSPESLIIDGKIVSNKDTFEGKEIKRVSRTNYLIKEGRYTSCTNTPADWRLYGNNIDLNSGEYAHMKDVVIESFGLPITYIPYLVLPIKNQRQSGFLPPSFGFGTDGFNIDESYFWAISRSHDATFTLGHYGSRGTKEAFETRSAFAEESDSQLNYFHISDTKFANSLYNGQPLGKKNRHAATLDQQFKFAETTYAKLKLQYVSDDNIPRDFPSEMQGRADPALESRLIVTTHTADVAYIADSAYYEDLLSKNPMASNKMQLQRFPELSVKLAKTKLSAFMFEGDVSYLNIYRSGPYFDDNNSDNVFNDTDFIRKGQRLDVFPRVSLPIATKLLKITPQAGVRYDYYMLPVGGNASRTYTDIKTHISSEISRVYQRGEDRQYRAIKHTIEPFVTYHMIPSVNESNHPFFNNMNGDVNSPMFDSIDSIGKTNNITYGITNRIMAKYIKDFISPKDLEEKKKKENTCENCTAEEEKEIRDDKKITTSSREDFLNLREKASKGRKKTDSSSTDVENFTVLQPIQWKVYQTYDFLNTNGKPFGYLRSDLLATYEWLNVLLSNFYNVYTKKFGTSSEIGMIDEKDYILLGYYHNKTEPTNNVDQFKFRLGFQVWRFGFNTRFILNNAIEGTLKDKIQDKYADITYYPPSSCWFLKVAATAPYDRAGIQYDITFNLLISGQAIGFGKEDGFWSKM